MISQPLKNSIGKIIEKYLDDLDGNYPKEGIYGFVFREMEISVYSTVYSLSGYNQSIASKILGVSRATFRSKAEYYKIINPRKITKKTIS